VAGSEDGDLDVFTRDLSSPAIEDT
jgi:hypothetical protein